MLAITENAGEKREEAFYCRVGRRRRGEGERENRGWEYREKSAPGDILSLLNSGPEIINNMSILRAKQLKRKMLCMKSKKTNVFSIFRRNVVERGEQKYKFSSRLAQIRSPPIPCLVPIYRLLSANE